MVFQKIVDRFFPRELHDQINKKAAYTKGLLQFISRCKTVNNDDNIKKVMFWHIHRISYCTADTTRLSESNSYTTNVFHIQCDEN